MADFLSPIALAYTLIKDTLIIAFRRPEIMRRREFRERIVFIQKSMIEIINNGQKILDFIKVANKLDTSENPELIKDIKFLASSQIRSIEKLSQSLSDRTWSTMFKLLMPDLRRHFHDPMFLKGKRLRMLLKVNDFDDNELRKLYNEAYLQKGEEILEELRRTADEVAQIIRAQIPFEDLQNF